MTQPTLLGSRLLEALPDSKSSFGPVAQLKLMLGRARIAAAEFPAATRERVGFALALRQLGIEQTLAHAKNDTTMFLALARDSRRSSTSAPIGQRVGAAARHGLDVLER